MVSGRPGPRGQGTAGGDGQGGGAPVDDGHRPAPNIFMQWLGSIEVGGQLDFGGDMRQFRTEHRLDSRSLPCITDLQIQATGIDLGGDCKLIASFFQFGRQR